ncbi:putative serine incorporator/TMS membrane protein [Helianthus annuus]|nr:putative serine incorporator/TMS membrane protein [Helianthus annuus]
MVIATFSTGIDSQCFQSRKDEKQEEDDVPYGFGFFHLVFASGVMYFAMLLIGWNSHHTMKNVDAGSTDRVGKSEGSGRAQISKLEGDNRHCVC